jgi:hypothetical protein
MNTDVLADLLSQGVRRRRLERAGLGSDIDKPQAAFSRLPPDEQQTWRDCAEVAIEMFGGEIVAEEVAHAALEQVLAWCEEQPQMAAHGDSTGASYQRGKIIATRVLPEQTVGISSYETVLDAQQKLARMERGYREWIKMTGGKPREPNREIEEKFGIPEGFGGFTGAWIDEQHAILLRVGEGRIIEGVRLTPLNALQALQMLDQLVRMGKDEGHIKPEHEQQSADIQSVVKASDYDPSRQPD